LQRCPYCDFATEAINPRDIPHEAYAEAVIAEARLRMRQRAVATSVSTIFFGGGTPSLWDTECLTRVVKELQSLCGQSVGEITVECNPTSLTADKCKAYVDAGINRVSIGVQSLRESHLRYLGRLHDADEARIAVATAAAHGGLRVSADLMFGMPDQHEAELVADAHELFALGAQHLSAYSLTIEANTRFGELARKGRLPRLPDDAVANLYLALESACEGAGLEHYEVSNYAAVEQRGRHNEHYWTGDEYLGLGIGAVGRYARIEAADRMFRYRNEYDLKGYFNRLERGLLGAEELEELSPQDLVREGLMLGLRTADGVSLGELQRRYKVDPREGRRATIAKHVSRKNLVDHQDVLVIPKDKWLVIDGIIADLF
jgi:oxygen-independent coproporphyrinogen-3 oxidase